jgi:hypothetical protein
MTHPEQLQAPSLNKGIRANVINARGAHDHPLSQLTYDEGLAHRRQKRLHELRKTSNALSVCWGEQK